MASMSMRDREETLLQARADAAYAALAAATRLATEATRARNKAKREYERALHKLVKHRESKPKEIQ